MESVGRLAGGIAHNFNNMLSIILGNAEIILEDLGPGHSLLENVTKIEKAGQRSAELTRQLLGFARKQSIAPKQLDLNQTIESMLKMLGRLLGEDIHLAWSPKQDLWPIRMAPSQIHQIPVNLCVNSRDAVKNGGQISIETDNLKLDTDHFRPNEDLRPGEYIMLAVNDNGTGMDEQTMDQLFDPFLQPKGWKRYGTGSGNRVRHRQTE